MTTAQESMDQNKFYKRVRTLEENIKTMLADIPNGAALSVVVEYMDSDHEEVIELNKAASTPFSPSREYAKAAKEATDAFMYGFEQGLKDGGKNYKPFNIQDLLDDPFIYRKVYDPEIDETSKPVNDLDCTENYVDYSNNDFIGKIGTIYNDTVGYAQKYLKRYFPELEVTGFADYETYQYFNKWLSAELGVAVKEFYNINWDAASPHESLLYYQRSVWIKAISLMLLLKGYPVGENGISGSMTPELQSAMNHFLSDRAQLLNGQFPDVELPTFDDNQKRLISRVELSDLFSGSCLIF